MAEYLTHLQKIYSRNTYKRKLDYFRYNFSGLFSKGQKIKALSVLEVGPGMGESLAYLNSLGVKNVDIFDNDESILKRSRKVFKIRRALLGKSIVAVGNKLHSYDLIFAVQVLEHMPVESYKRTVEILYRHLKPGGRLIFVVPNANNPLGLAERYGDLQHYNSFTEQSLKELLVLADIKNFSFKISGFEIPPYSMLNVIRIFLQKILHLILLLTMIINGGSFFRVMTPNIVLSVRKNP